MRWHDGIDELINRDPELRGIDTFAGQQGVVLVFTYLEKKYVYTAHCILGSEFGVGKKVPESSLEGKIDGKPLAFQSEDLKSFVEGLEKQWDKAEVGYQRQNPELPQPGDVMFSYTLVPIGGGWLKGDKRRIMEHYGIARAAAKTWQLTQQGLP